MPSDDAPLAADAELDRRQTFWLVSLCFLISGFAALLYETAWLRQFAVLLGTTEQALATVLASYMGGLAFGSWVAARRVETIRRPLRTYGLLEFGIAMAALAVPYGLVLWQKVQAALLGGNPELPTAGGSLQGAFSFLTAFSLILVPTALMGATLPLLARHVVRHDAEVGPKIGLLYAINTAGAVLGTLGAAFLFLPTLGLARTTWVGAAANVLVFVVVLRLVRGRGERLVAPSDALAVGSAGESENAAPVKDLKPTKGRSGKKPEKSIAPKRRRGKKTRERKDSAASEPAATRVNAARDHVGRYRMIVWFSAFGGGISFCIEILFTRMLGHMLGGSVFAFATMLAGFLLGIALGGAIASRLATGRRIAAIHFVHAQSLAALCTLLAYHAVNRMVVWDWQAWGGASSTSVQVLTSIIVLLPTATCVGATFPLAIRVFVRGESEAASGAARIYLWNVAGGILGAMLTGALFLPAIQYQGVATLAMAGNLGIAVGTLLLFGLPLKVAVAPTIAVVVLAVALPQAPENVLRVSALTGEPTDGELLFNHAGRSATVSVFYDKGHLRFQTNGLPESTVVTLGRDETRRNNSTWLSALPPLLRTECKSMLIIGLGGGVAAEHVPPSVETIDVLEIEPAVVEANRAIASLRNRDPLSDPRINVVINDGRNALALTEKRYDAIVSQPSHPWTAGASHLYTQEFDALVRDRLNPGGIFLQWMNSAFVDESLMRSMAATLRDVFPSVRLYQPFSGTFMFVASDRPIEPESLVVAGPDTRLATISPADRTYYQRLGVVTPSHLLAMLSADEQGLQEMAADSEIICDERNLLAMRAPRLLSGDHQGRDTERFVDSFRPVLRGNEVLAEICPTFDRLAYTSRRMEHSNIDFVREFDLPLFEDAGRRAVAEAYVIRGSGPSSDWFAYLAENARRYPENESLTFLCLSNLALGKPINLSPSERQQMRSRLGEPHRLIVSLLEELVRQRLESAKTHDTTLAKVSVDDVAFEFAVRLRLPWRLESQGIERVSRGTEAIAIIDDAAPFANESGLGWFRASAAINAGQPLTALGTIEQMADGIERARTDPDVQVDSAAVGNLIRCQGLLADSRPFAAVEPRYREVKRAIGILLQSIPLSGSH